MNAKEKQTEFIKSYLKPTLKQFGYQTSGQTWWKDKGDFFNVINLQNYSWNSRNSVDFTFNVGIALKALLKDVGKKKATLYDLIVHLRENALLPNPKERPFGNNQGYSITDETDLTEFVKGLKVDFESYILPGLDKPSTLADCVAFYERFEFWGSYLKRVLQENSIEY